jgi:acetolactate synthase-1/2/3 large subunit
MELTGAQIVVQALVQEGVTDIFGYPGGAVLDIYDALDQQDDVRHVLVRHEQGAVHAADGYARASGRTGVALVTSGPGVTNAVTGIATAYMDSIPLVILSGQVPTRVIGSDAFQEVDAVGITRPCVKHNFLVKDVAELAVTIKKAFHIAGSGRPGPVLVDIPKDVSQARRRFVYPREIELRSYRPVTRGHPGQIRRALQLMLAARRPVLYTGGGVILDRAAAELTELARLLGFPVTNTLMGLGGFPGTDPLFMGMLGMHGTYEANMAMYEADVVVAIGARFDDRVVGNVAKFCPRAKIIHVDIDPASIAKTVKVDVPIVGSVKLVLSDMLTLLHQSGRRPDGEALAAWWAAIEGWRSADCLRYDRHSAVIKPQQVIEQLYQLSRGEAIVTSDVGQHQMWAAQFYKFDRPNRWINSGGLGTMGFGLPAAIGAKLACPQDQVICVTGEASIIMCIQELSTALQYQVPITVVNLNNRYMGMVRQWQEFFYAKRYAMSYMDALPDFVKLAESFGHVGFQVKEPEQLRDTLEQALALRDRLVFVDVLTDPTENVYPMIPAGAGHNEMILV